MSKNGLLFRIDFVHKALKMLLEKCRANDGTTASLCFTSQFEKIYAN